MDTPITPATGVVAISSSIVVEATHGDGSKFALRFSDNTNSSAADYSPGMPPSFSLEGKNRHGEEGALEHCATLLEHLRPLGHAYSGLRRLTAQEENALPGVDCVAMSESDCLQMQVTRAIGDPDLRRTLATSGRVARDYADAAAAADSMQDSVLRKHHDLRRKFPSIDLGQITLVLDSSETLCLVLGGEVVSSFRTRHSESARELGFKAIWLVGPAPQYVFKLA